MFFGNLPRPDCFGTFMIQLSENDKDTVLVVAIDRDMRWKM